MDDKIHPTAIEHLPFFITGPGQTDILFNVMVVFMLVAILAVGNLYFQLHAFPERMAHRTNVVQMEVVAVLALISLFTHNHLFWIAGLLLALIRFPDFSSPLGSIADSLQRLAGRRDARVTAVAVALPGSTPGVATVAGLSPDPALSPEDEPTDPSDPEPGTDLPRGIHPSKEGN